MKDKILLTILDNVDTPLTGFPISEVCPPFSGYSSDLKLGDGLCLVYNDESTENVELESLETSVTDNPLSGMVEVTIKLQLKKEEKE